MFAGHNIDRNPMEPFGRALGFPTRLQPYERHGTCRAGELVLLDVEDAPWQIIEKSQTQPTQG
jgi:hypothetical protein